MPTIDQFRWWQAWCGLAAHALEDAGVEATNRHEVATASWLFEGAELWGRFSRYPEAADKWFALAFEESERGVLDAVVAASRRVAATIEPGTHQATVMLTAATYLEAMAPAPAPSLTAMVAPASGDWVDRVIAEAASAVLRPNECGCAQCVSLWRARVAWAARPKPHEVGDGA